jgi:hypothetical protein
MFKGFIILLGVGALFAYFVFNFVGDVEKDDPTSHVGKNEKEARAYARYYHIDDAGNRVLDLSSLSVEEAKKVWHVSPIRQRVLEQFPQFQYMKETIMLYLPASPFRSFLLQRLEKVEGDYLSGTIDARRARVILRSI